ncbi:uncharacterized protein LOC110849766 [Folsomia candida]|uniref:Layilin n=1 Tax=Folsomia candida TaxID=158441 RepID=A0A226E8T6_FOLCA|nr:uncharacterized protein LOC110849766 [Folsomia candida]OXA53909.1 Layilin [Folsomia candida]
MQPKPSSAMRFLTISTVLIAWTSMVTVESGFTTVIHGDLELDVSDEQLPFDDAFFACYRNNKTLLSVDSEGKDRILVDLFINGGSNVTLPGTQSWIAARESREGVWVNVVAGSLQPLYYTRWFIDQPDDTENLSCAFQHTLFDLNWRDGNCSAPFYFICESTIAK